MAETEYYPPIGNQWALSDPRWAEHRVKLDYPPPPELRFDWPIPGRLIPDGPGLYFFWRKEQVVYVGQSLKLRFRVRGHYVGRSGDKVSWLEMQESELNYAEAFYIGVFRPILNFNPNKQPVKRHRTLTDYDELMGLCTLADLEAQNGR